MNSHQHSHILPGELHVICGPMKSGKSREIMRILDTLSYMTNISILAIKPDIDTRKIDTRSNLNLSGVEFKLLNAKNPELSNEFFKNNFHDVVIIDECQFFDLKIISQIDELLKKEVYIICAGLDLDFRGETFGPMGDLLSRANYITKLSGICEFEGCNRKATRTQREINSKPAHYNSPIILIGDEKEGYSCRCLKHHIVLKDSLHKYIQ
ncbi:MAG: thymidine kinase [Nanoarchaeota archaeon]|nr:thymidine kinase [Nanoarchaeota archaeon]